MNEAAPLAQLLGGALADWSPLQQLGVVLAAALLLGFGLTLLTRRFERVGERLGAPLRAVRNLVLPCAVLAWTGRSGVLGELNVQTLRVIETLLWVMVLHSALALLNAIVFQGAKDESWRAHVPKLFLDLTRFFVVLVGSGIILTVVWGKDLGGLLAALGVGSIVIGLALQDTLGNLMSGIALLFERPLSVGDWIEVGGATGKVVEMNWRGARLLTRELELVIVPNSVLGKEVIKNFSHIDRRHAERVVLGFSYDDAPGRVKRILKQAALDTRGVLDDPEPLVRTISYDDFAITYEVKLHMADYGPMPDVLDAFMSRVWYAARRGGLNIPFPIRTIYKTEVPYVPGRDRSGELAGRLNAVSAFHPLEPADIEELAGKAATLRFTRGERVVEQGDAGDTLYLLLEGRAQVLVRDERRREREVATLGAGEFFGEMALLTGAPRSATVRAVEDLEVMVVGSSALKPVLERRPELARQMAELVEKRRAGLEATRDSALPADEKRQIENRADVLVSRIKHFLGL